MTAYSLLHHHKSPSNFLFTRLSSGKRKTKNFSFHLHSRFLYKVSIPMELFPTCKTFSVADRKKDIFHEKSRLTSSPNFN